MQKITLQNRFHQTTVTIKPDVFYVNENSAQFYLSKWQVKKIRRNLCGMDDCVCGTIDDPRVISCTLNDGWNNGEKDWRKGFVVFANEPSGIPDK